MKSLFLGLAIHNHQPSGNFEWVFEKAYRQAYLPMIEALDRHPQVRMALHYSGCLLDWIETNRPEFLTRLASLAGRGQIEIMTGGYYEPILPSIPDADKLGQIAKLSSYVRDKFDYQPTGLWLAERVWEPHLPKLLQQAGVHWTVVDDNHFKRAGLSDEDLFGYYITEEEGAMLRVFGTSKELRYIIPWRPVNEVMRYLRSVAWEGQPRITVMGDDGEKFGIWPDTYEKCWESGWVEDLFTAFEENADWLHTIAPGDFARLYPPIGRVYLPTASYVEMMEWVLPARRAYEYSQIVHRLEAQGQHDALQFMAGGFWRSFMVKYPEVNNMHKKMLRVHRKVETVRALGHDNAGQQQLWEGQCNCAYWHGVFGGTYLNHVRSAVFENLIRAEAQAEEVLYGGGDYLETEWRDFNCDGAEEQLVDGRYQSLSISPSQGGGILEWDLRQPPYNLTNVLTRRPEGYHQVLRDAELAKAASTAATDAQTANIHEVVRWKEEGLSQRLYYDRHDRLSMLDHLLALDTTVHDYARARHRELGDYASQLYDLDVSRDADSLCLTLARTGRVALGRRSLPLRVERRLRVPTARPGLEVEISLGNQGNGLIECRYGSEWNLNLLGSSDGSEAFLIVDGERLHGWSLESTVDLALRDLVLGNPALGWQLRIELSEGCRLWCSPLEAISNSEAGFERTYQGTALLFHWPLRLELGKTFRSSLTLLPEALTKLR